MGKGAVPKREPRVGVRTEATFSRAPGSEGAVRVSQLVNSFTPLKRALVIELVRGGASLTTASKAAGISRRAAWEWAKRGRTEAGTERAEFAELLDRAAVQAREQPPPLSVADLVRLLEREARGGSVAAAKLLLERLDRGASKPADPLASFDELGRKRAQRGGGA